MTVPNTRWRGRTAWARNVQTPLRVFLRTETGGAAVLLGATVTALLWTFVGFAPSTRCRDTSVAREKAKRIARVTATAVPCPGSLIATALATRIAARPTGPANQVS